ncbi:MAG: methylamine utilization protein MauJ [Candidatus Hodarchaeota archaeon]
MKKDIEFWEVAIIETDMAWPDVETEYTFKGNRIIILPETEKFYPAVALAHTLLSKSNEAKKIILDFCTYLAWAEDHGIYVKFWTGGSTIMRVQKGSAMVKIPGKINIKYLPEPKDESAKLALALYNDAMALNHYAYKFLGFYKIINLKFPNRIGKKSAGQLQKDWINENLELLDDGRAIDRIEEINKIQPDVGDYLYLSGRCAVAHAGLDPTIDPNNIEDSSRLYKDIPLIQALARHLIRTEYSIKTSRDIYREHLYELAGFKILLGEELSQNLKDKIDIPIEKLPSFPKICIRLHDKAPYHSLQNLTVHPILVKDGIVELLCKSDDDIVKTIIRLDFPEERLKINVHDEIECYDNGSSESLLKAANLLKFEADYLCNGSIEIWDFKNEKLLARLDPYIPVNIDIGRSCENLEKMAKTYINKAKEREL